MLLQRQATAGFTHLGSRITSNCDSDYIRDGEYNVNDGELDGKHAKLTLSSSSSQLKWTLKLLPVRIHW